MKMKTYFAIKVLILTDKKGEWWEFLKKDDSFRRFKPGTADYLDYKSFKDSDKAIKHAKSMEYERIMVIRIDPPVKPSITWEQTIVWEK